MTYLSSGLIVMQIHEIPHVSRLLRHRLFGSVDKLARELNPVPDVVTAFKTKFEIINKWNGNNKTQLKFSALFKMQEKQRELEKDNRE